MKTIKQIADGIGIDKQRVYRYICRNHITPMYREAGVMYYDDAVESLVKSHFAKSEYISDVRQTTSNDVVIDVVISMLKKELDIKNQQISELTMALENTTASLKASQALHAGTMQRQLTDGAPTPIQPERTGEFVKQGFFQRLFKNRNTIKTD